MAPRGDERLLQRVHRTVRRETLDRGHLVAVGRHREHETRLDGLAVEEDRARTAVAEVAPPFGAGQPEVVSQQLEEGDVGPHRNAAGVAVDREMDYSSPSVSLPMPLPRFRSRFRISDFGFRICHPPPAGGTPAPQGAVFLPPGSPSWCSRLGCKSTTARAPGTPPEAQAGIENEELKIQN